MLAEEKTARPLKRIDDTSFLFETSDRPVLIVLPGIKNDGRLARQVAEAAFDILQDEEVVDPKFFEVRNRRWKLISKSHEKAGIFDSLWSLANYVQTVHENTLAKTYMVKEYSWPNTLGLNFYYDSYEEEFPERSIPYADCFERGGFEHETSPPFSDPFTRLSTIAFQEQENAFCHRDYFSLDQYQTRIVYHEGQFSLVKSTDPLAQDIGVARATIDFYQKYILETYGSKKIEEILARYNLTFDEAVGLTPEHVYRINVGVHELCLDDVQDLWDSILSVLESCTWEEAETPLETYFRTIPSDLLPGRIKRALFQQFDKPWKGAKKGDLCTWSRNLESVKSIKSVRDLPPKLFDGLMALLIPDDEACDRSLTGRKSYGGAQGYYTNAQTREYKPWVDQQDCFQTIVLLRKERKHELFYEKLAFVISKKHLARRLADGHYRVGGLIPAPIEDGWYEVTSCVSLSTGIMSYTLESALTSKPLDDIKLFRSTASDACALRSKESLLCDINWANSPGYMGRRLGEKYEFPFFQQRSIPVWYGYVLWAKKKLTLKPAIRYLDEIYQCLSKANDEFLKYMTHDVEAKTLKQVIREHDEIINFLYRKRRRQFGSFSDIRSHFRKSATRTLISTVDKGNDLEIAKNLFEDLQGFSEIETEPGVLHRIVELKNDIFCHALPHFVMSHENKGKSVQDWHCDIFDMKTKFGKAGCEEDKLEILSMWLNRFEDIAHDRQESLKFKKPGNLVLTGHSLGGACVMSYLDLYFRKQSGGRIPLPGRYCAGYVFDDPGTNDADNEKFKAWGFEHCELQKQLESKFYIRRIHEKGDIIVSGGEVHLGATYSKGEAERLSTWLENDLLLRERLPKPKNLSIALSPCAHGTMFEEGVPGVDYFEEKAESYHLGELGTRGKIKSVYNRCSKEFNRVRCDEEERQLIWDDIRLKWNLGGAIVKFDSESFRTNSWVETVVNWFWGSQSDDRINHLTDHHGVFVVTNEGVISKLESSDEGEADGV